jgi:DNA repair photolyase
VTLITADRTLCRRIEPRAPTPERRLQAMHGLAQAGLRVDVFAMPLLPLITDRQEDPEALLHACAAAGAQLVVADAFSPGNRSLLPTPPTPSRIAP